jgi:hypothetical protein
MTNNEVYWFNLHKMSLKRINLGTRKLGKKGAGFCVMLPTIWLKNSNVKPGDRLKIEMLGDALFICPEVKK